MTHISIALNPALATLAIFSGTGSIYSGCKHISSPQPDGLILDYGYLDKMIKFFGGWRSPKSMFLEFANSIRISTRAHSVFHVSRPQLLK